MKRIFLVSLAITLCLAQTQVSGRSAPWPCFLHDASNSGQTDVTTFEIPGLLWTVATGSVVYSSPVVDEGEIIYFGSYDSRMLALTQQGELVWDYQTDGEIDSTPLITADGLVVVCALDGGVYAFTRDGTLQWRYDTGSSIRRSAPVQAPDGAIVVGTLAGQVVILEATGQLRRVESVPAAVWSSPAISSNSIAYIGCDDGQLYAFDLATPGVHWQYDAGSAVRSAVIIGPEGEVYCVSIDGLVLAVNADASLRWSYPLEARVDYGSPARGTDGVLYLGSSKGFHAVNSDGSLKWSYSGSQFRGAPAIDGNGIVISGADDGKVYGFSSEGQVSWVYPTGGLISSAPAIGATGNVYIGSFDRNLYALFEATPTPTMTVTLTPTMTPTVTPSPTPKLPPLVLAAGFMNSAVSKTTGGTFAMAVWVEDQDGDAIQRVEVLYNGAVVVQLPESSYPGFYLIDPVAIGPGLMNGDYWFQIQATDASGMTSDPWPQLVIHEGTEASKNFKGNQARLQQFIKVCKDHLRKTAPTGESPFILAAGYYRSYLVDGESGELTIMAIVDDPANDPSGLRVEVFYDHQGTGIYLLDDGQNNDLAPRDGVFGLAYAGVFGPGLSGVYDLQIAATNAGGQSSLWPYLTVTR